MGLVRPGAPGLLAGDEVLVALPHRPALDPRGIAAGVRLGEGGRGQQLSGAQAGKELLLLLLGARATVRVGDGHRYRPPREERFFTRILRSYTHTSSPRWFLPVVRTWTMPRSGLLPLSRLSSTSLDEISVSPG